LVGKVPPRRIGIDVGGTFTDAVLLDTDSEQIRSVKVATTPANPVLGALNGIRAILRESGVEPGTVGFIGHGTTIATNLVVESKGAPTALVTTKGFRDLLEIRRAARHDRADLYDLFFENPAPLVPRCHRFEVEERILHDGSVYQALDHESLAAALEAVERSGAEAVAIVFLNAHANSAHEAEAYDRTRKRFSHLFVTASHHVDPEIFEYERTSTTVINAMLGPRCVNYVEQFRECVASEGIGCEVLFMQSNGGLATPSAVAERPVALLESGPAGGVTAAAKLCQRLGIANAITGDMGGTTFDVSLIRDGRPEIRTQSHLQSHVVRAPTIDIESIGAGGGSVAWLDEGLGLHVGPQSAGADPGPACYGRGGVEPTVTDCNLVLGYIDPATFLSGSLKLDVAAARRAIETKIARPLGMSLIDAARSVRALANALMAQAVRLMTVERGFDPREFSYICFGGGGAVHAADLAGELQIPRIVVPPLPGLFSAYGMLVADQLYDLQMPMLQRLDELGTSDLTKRFAELEAAMQARLERCGVSANDNVEIIRRADCRYIGQAESLLIDIDKPDITPSQLVTAFAETHARHWNFVQPERPVQVVNLRVQAKVPTKAFAVPSSKRGSNGAMPRRRRAIVLDAEFEHVPVFDREDLGAGSVLAGPAVIEEPSSCLVLPRGWHLQVAPDLSLIVTSEP
jgi:N-methylhydantoinase A